MQFSDLDLTKTYAYSDYLKWTFDERLELKHVFLNTGSFIRLKRLYKDMFLLKANFKQQGPFTVGDEGTTPVLPGFILNLNDFFDDKNGLPGS